MLIAISPLMQMYVPPLHLLRAIRGGRLLSNVVIHQKLLKCLENIYSQPLSKQNAFILCFNHVSTNASNFVNLFKHYLLDFNTYNHTISWKIIEKSHELPCIAYDCGLLGAKYVKMHNLQRLDPLFLFSFEIVALCSLFSMQALQTNKHIEQEILSRFMPPTIF